MLSRAVRRLTEPSRPLQLTAVSEPALRGLRVLFSPDEVERLGIELVPPGNLVSRVCRMARIQTLRAAQSGQVVAAIAEACHRLPSDSPLAQTASMPGIHRALAECLGTLRAYGFDAGRLDLAAEEAEPYLALKLRSLGFLLRESSESLRELGREQITAWLERTVASDPAECDDGGHIAIVVGGHLEPALAEWITWLSRTRATVTVIGEVHPGVPSMFGDLAAFFPGVKPDCTVDESALSSRLFVRGAAPQSLTALDVVAAPDVLAECEWAIRRCQAVVESDEPNGNVGIVAREISAYAPVLQAAARRLGVELDLPWRAPLLSNRLVSFFLDLLTALGSTDVRALIKPLRSPYSGLSLETLATVEAVLRDLRRSGPSAWDLLETVSSALTDQIAWLEPVLEWRTEALSRPGEPWEWFGRIMTLADLIPWQDAATEFPQFIERDGRAQSAMQRAITERASLAKVRRAPPLGYDEAIDWMREAWEEADYSVPSLEGGIRVVSNGSELGDVSTVVALGMLEGILPRRPREDPILGDLERDALSKLAALTVPLPTSSHEATHEREEFVRICAAAGERLVLSYRLATGDRNNIPTAYIDEAVRLCEATTKTIHSRTQFVPDNPTFASDLALAAALEVRQSLGETDFVSANVRERFRWGLDRPFEPQQLRRATQCPFRFFARDQLNLRPSRRLQLWTRLLELPITAELANQSDRVAAESALSTALEELVDAQVGRLADWELAVIRSGGRTADDRRLGGPRVSRPRLMATRCDARKRSDWQPRGAEQSGE